MSIQRNTGAQRAAPAVRRNALRLGALLLSAVAMTGPRAASASASASATDTGDDPIAHDYHLGRGWHLPQVPLTIGGYETTQLSKLEDSPWQLDETHLSAFLWWQPMHRLRLFSEIDGQNLVTVQSSGVSSNGAYLALERLYVDWTQSDALNLRLGKFLTPIGRWNLVHADPLVWTTSRPLITQATFPTNATGAMAYGTLNELGHGVDYSFYGSIGSELRPDPRQNPFNEAYGVHLSYPLVPALQLGLSYAGFEQRNDPGNHKNLLGADAIWTHAGYEVTAEAAYRYSSQGTRLDESGGFVQGVAPLADKIFGVARYEYYDRAGNTPGVNLWLLGLDYRYNRAVIFKSEFSKGVHNRLDVPEGFATSLAVLF